MAETADNSRIIITKVLVPRKRQTLYPRTRLLNFLYSNTERKLILISAAPGCGKTSLLIDFAHSTDLPVCWCTLSETDQDATTLCEYLVAAIRQRFPGFGSRSEALLRGMQGAAPDTQAMVTVLVNEIHEQIPEYFMLILDDFHLIEGSPSIQSFFDPLLRHLPENCHIIIASRTVPNLPLVRLAAQLEVAGLSTTDLNFTVEEIQGLLRFQFDLNLPDAVAAELARESEGWITGIVLRAQTSGQGMAESLTRARGTPEQVFQYLAREAFSQQPREVRDFLRDTSILHQLNAGLCNDLLHIRNADEIIESLEHRNLFVTRLEGREIWYRYSRMFQEFLQDRLRREEQALFLGLHGRAAALLEARGALDEAVYHWFQAQAYGEARRLMRSIAPGMFEAGRLEMLRNWIDQLPEAMLDGAPDLLVTRGVVFIVQGELREARQALQRARRVSDAEDLPAIQATVLVYESAIAARKATTRMP